MTAKHPSTFSKAEAARRLAPVFHPRWCSAEDCLLMTARAAGENFTAVAERLGRSRVAVEQRFHRLRVLPYVIALLNGYGLTTRPYAADGGAS